jgi:hypothetical protein
MRIIAAVISFLIAGSALAQNSGSVTNHAFPIGKGSGVSGYTSLLCGSGQLALGQSAADPICQTITGDVTITSAGVTAIGANTVTTTAIIANAVTNAKLATMGAFTLKGNSTGSSATPGDIDIAALTTKASPAAGDYVLLSDQAASGAYKKATVASVGTGGSGVSSLNGQTGAIVQFLPPQGRLTLATGIAVMTSTVTAANTVYYTPSNGNLIPIYDGTNMVPTAAAEISQLTTDATKSPAAATTNSNYDVFVWNDSGTIRATRGPPWTSNSTRGTGAGTTELVLTNGILLNKISITNGPAASRGTYVGTIRTNGTSTIDYIVGGSASGGTAGLLGVWNMYNRNLSTAQSIDSGANYTYATATIRQARASAGNQISVLTGLSVDTVAFSWQIRIATVAVVAANSQLGIGEDSTTTFASIGAIVQTSAASIFVAIPVAWLIKVPSLGFHVYAAVEVGNGSDANTFISGGTFTAQVWN